MYTKTIKIFLRLSLGISFLSAVADRFGLWDPSYSAWGNWDNFVAYTALVNPFYPAFLISPLAVVATAAEVVFGLFLLVGFKTETTAKLSGWLLLLFALSMAFSIGIKSAFDYSVFTAAAAAFALSTMKEKHWELDVCLKRKR